MARDEGRFHEAAALLEAVDLKTLDHRMSGEVQVLLGQLYDRLGDATKAFPRIVEGNSRLALATGNGEANASRYLKKSSLPADI